MNKLILSCVQNVKKNLLVLFNFLTLLEIYFAPQNKWKGF